MLVGYARVSTEDQQLDLQLDALKSAGCERVFQDTMSGAKTERPGLTEMLDFMREGDTLVVWKLDRLGRSLQHLIEVVSTLDKRSIGFRCLTQNIDTTTSGGRLVFAIFGAIAEFERDMIRERSIAGLKAARARGRLGGRRFNLTEGQRHLVKKLYQQGMGREEICEHMGVQIAHATFHRYVKG